MRVFLAGAVLLLAASGCGVLHGGHGERQEVSREQLAIMVVPGSGLGPAYAKFTVDSDSGAISASEYADDTLDPDDTAGSVKRAGWRAGYALQYSDPKGVAAHKQRGLQAIGTQVNLFETASAARADIIKTVGDFASYEWSSVAGVKIVSSEEFLAELGDEAWGYEAKISAGNLRFRVTTVAFRRGPVEGVAAIYREDGTAERLEAIRIAQLLVGRVDGVLAGRISGEPLSLSASTPRISRARIAAMTLAVKDFSEKLRLTKERLNTSKQDNIAFVREFDLPGGRLGGSRVLSIRDETQVYADARGVKFFKKLLAGKQGAEFFRDAIVDEFKDQGVKPRDVKAHPLKLEDRRTLAFALSVTARAKRFDFAFAVVDRKRSLAMLTIFAPAGGIKTAAVEALAARARAKLG